MEQGYNNRSHYSHFGTHKEVTIPQTQQKITTRSDNNVRLGDGSFKLQPVTDSMHCYTKKGKVM